ncbi:hypothetical protein GBA52_024344 [Prunus armeniaca]|nr:hypothetical protein GBA52_024344 [Prunus armeniaca]
MARNLVVLIRQLLGNRNHPCAAGFLHHLHDKPIQNLTSVPNTASSSPIRVDIRFAPTQLFQSLRQGHDPSATLLSDSDQFQIFYFQVAQTYSSLIASSSVTMHLIKLKINVCLLFSSTQHAGAGLNISGSMLDKLGIQDTERNSTGVRSWVPWGEGGIHHHCGGNPLAFDPSIFFNTGYAYPGKWAKQFVQAE